ncbi:MAG: methyltransferase [Gammaproteobacteria bacterium]
MPTENPITFNVPQGSFTLRRLPRRRKELLQAWDAADSLLLEHLVDQPMDAAKLLVLNDAFGALTVALNSAYPDVNITAQSDSFLSQQATMENLEANDGDSDAIQLIDSLAPLDGPYDLVLIKLPKTLALLEHELIQLRPHIRPDTRIIAAGMVKAIPESAWKLMERIIGPTRPSRAVRKARMIFVQPHPERPAPTNPYPVAYPLEGTDITLINHANVFSRDSLDIGSRFMLEHLPETTGDREVIDLGCGNGVLGLMAARSNPLATIRFVDESAMAVASARENFEAVFGESREASFIWGDGLATFADQSADLVLCNPPFHQQQAVGTQIAIRMFNQSRRVLRPGGELWVVGNRHLEYAKELRRIFAKVEQVAANRKFVVLKAREVGSVGSHSG